MIMFMITFGFFGLSGQGVETAVRLFSKACFLSGMYVQGFTMIGRTNYGWPVRGYVKVDIMPILSKQIEDPDFYLVMDPSFSDAKAFKEGSTVIFNSPSKVSSDALKRRKIKTYSVDATEIALQQLKSNIPNTAMLGAVAKLYSKVSMKNLKTALEADNIAKVNMNAVEEGYRSVR